MATQGQRRAEVKSAVRRLRQEYRKADSAGEKVERELDRLIKRKTLISPDDMASAANKLADYIRMADSIQKLYSSIWEIIKRNS